MDIMGADKLNALIDAWHFEDAVVRKFTDPELRTFLTYVHVINKLEEEALQNDDSKDAVALFYSRYYWFDRFKKRYITLYGDNAGLEQQAFKMLEHFSEYYPGELDWGFIERIDNGSIY